MNAYYYVTRVLEDYIEELQMQIDNMWYETKQEYCDLCDAVYLSREIIKRLEAEDNEDEDEDEEHGTQIEMNTLGKMMTLKCGDRVVLFNGSIMRWYVGMDMVAMGSIDYATAHKFLEGN